MKVTFNKILSFILALSLVISSMFVAAIVANAATTPNYYIKNGGTGNGKSAETPAADLDTVIKQINADGLAAGDTANVYVMQDATCNTAGNAHGMAYMMSTAGTLTTHTAEIVVQSYDESANYLTFSNTLGTQQAINLAGPMSIKNIKIVAPNSSSFINLNAGNIKFLEGTTYGYATGNTTPINVSEFNKLPVSLAHSQQGGIAYDEDANIVFKNAFLYTTFFIMILPIPLMLSPCTGKSIFSFKTGV